ncbi:MAG: energy transducer TonB [Thermodesulfobacteriota bacterium]
MSTKNFIDEGPTKLRISLLISICVHAVLVWFFIASGPKLDWLSKRALPYKKPAIIQIVELPPGYKPPKTTKKTAKKPTRYADRTSVVEKESIPEGITVKRRIKVAQRGAKKAGGGAPESGAKGSILKKSSGGEAPEKSAVKKAQAGAPKSGAKGAPLKKSTGKEPDEKPSEPAGAGEAKVTTLKKPGRETPAVTASKRAGEKAAARRGGGGPGRTAAEKTPGPGASTKGPNLLLSEEKVAQLEREYQSAAPKGEKNRTLLLNTTELKYQKYFIDLKHKIELYWEYPPVAVRNGWQGKLDISFAINKDGTLRFVRTKTSSRYAVLDDAAETAIKLAAPFPPFPENFNVEEIKITGQFVYHIVNIPDRKR